MTYNTSYACTDCNAAQGYVKVLVMVENNFYSRCMIPVLNSEGEIQKCYAYDINFNCICTKMFVDVLDGGKVVKKCINRNPDVNCEIYDTKFKCLRCVAGFETN